MSYHGLQCKVVGDLNTREKASVYFCCHKDDFDKYFEKVANDLFDCNRNIAIWYLDAQDAEHNFTDEELELFRTDLQQMQLFVIPVTSNFLFTENAARQNDFGLAKEQHIPILPITMEPELEETFNAKCGDLQCVSAVESDSTKKTYAETLKEFVENVVTGNKLAEKIKAAFDAYIFLSYRKKDRKYAQELMRLIHKNDFCRDIAIWYDEFLVPGENFNDAIKAAFEKSKFFALAVTPSLLENPNYVLTTEYPMAKDANKDILPVELLPTDKEELNSLYKEIPGTVLANEADKLGAALKNLTGKVLSNEQNNTPEHLFFIGLAYLSGIDMEVDREKAVELISKAAEAGLPEAQKKLVSVYMDIEGRTSKNAVMWQEKYTENCCEQFGRLGIEYFNAKLELVALLNICGNIDTVEKLSDELYEQLQQMDIELQKLVVLTKNYADVCEQLDVRKLQERAIDLYVVVYRMRQDLDDGSSQSHAAMLSSKLDCLCLPLLPDVLNDLFGCAKYQCAKSDLNESNYVERNSRIFVDRRAVALFKKTKCAEDIVAECEKKYGKDSALWRKADAILTQFYAESGKFEEAIARTVDLLSWYQENRREKEECYIDALRFLAKTYQCACKFEEAISAFSKVVTLCEEKYGAGAPYVLRGKTELLEANMRYAGHCMNSEDAAIRLKAEEIVEANRPLVLRILDEAIKTLGEKHPDVMMLIEKFSHYRGDGLWCRYDTNTGRSTTVMATYLDDEGIKLLQEIRKDIKRDDYNVLDKDPESLVASALVIKYNILIGKMDFAKGLFTQYWYNLMRMESASGKNADNAAWAEEQIVCEKSRMLDAMERWSDMNM